MPCSNMVSPPQFLSHPNSVLLVQITHLGNIFYITVLISPGAAGNFINHILSEKLQLSLQPLPHPLKAHALDGGPSRGGLVTHCTEPITLHFSAMHQKSISFLIVTTKFLVVVGFPKTKASGLPLHHTYHCATGLLVEATPLHNCIYPYLSKKSKLWKNILKKPSNRGTYTPPLLQPSQVSSSWRKKGWLTAMQLLQSIASHS